MARVMQLAETVLLLYTCVGVGVWAYTQGAPDTTCSSLEPGHRADRQTSPSPYTVTPGAVEVAPGQRMLVTLEAPEDDYFMGFLVQARSSDTQDVVGTFFTTDHSYLTCGKGFNNAVTHNSGSAKSKVTLQWEPPSDFEGDIVFMCSFVKKYNTFWVGVSSEKVTVTKRSVPQQSGTPTTADTTPATTTTITTTTTTTNPVPVSSVVDTDPAENAGDVVISVVDAPSVAVVENDLSDSTPTSSSFPTSLSTTTDSPSSSLRENDNSPSTDPPETTTQKNRSKPPRRFGLSGRFKTTTTKPTTEKTTTTTTRRPIRRPSDGLSIISNSVQRSMEDIYLGCGEIKGCFGFPDGCEKSENCKIIVTYTEVTTGYHFEIRGTTGTSGYVAAALSDDEKMGSDSVMACSNQNGEVDVVMAINRGKSNELLTNNKYGLSDIKTLQLDGEVYCSFIRQRKTEIEGMVFDLEADRYHVMLAQGPIASNGLRYHEQRTVSSGTSTMSEFKKLEVASELLKTLHACFMIGAWICAASCGIILARYYKQTWLRSRCCGIDQWFHFHRLFMGLTWGLTVAGIVLIAYYLKGWSQLDPQTNPHAILGVVSTALCFIQPFMALCRCSPTHRRRPIFNWLHWFVGNSAQIIGITAIFFGLELVGAPSWTMFILIVFIAFHCVVHLILSIGQCVSDSKQERHNNVFPMKEMNGSRNPLHPVDKRTDAPGATFRKTMLAIYFIVNWLITALLILIIVVGEDQLKDWNLIFWEK